MKLALFSPFAVLVAASLAAAAPAADPSATSQTPAGDYSLTIYSSAAPGQLSTNALAGYAEHLLPGYALVRDSRQMSLAAGSSELRFTDVARRIDPTTVSFASLSDPEGTRVVEQNFQFDLVSQQKLIERFIGSEISVDQVKGDRVETVTGTLLSAEGGLILQKPSGEIVTLSSYASGDVRFPSLPGGLITKPTLVWLLDAKKGGAHDTRVSYQTSGMTWWSDYNVTLREQDGACDMDFAAWVTIVNRAGASFTNSHLRLVAGEVNRAPSAPLAMQMVRRKAELAAADAAEGFQETTLSEYHLYTLGRRTDLPDNSTKQLELFPVSKSVPCRKELVFSAEPPYMPYYSAPISEQGYAATVEGKTGAYLEFDNEEEAGMGMPLPAGRVRANQAAKDGSLEFVGEDVIKHTPRGETVRVKLGNSFDIAGERKQTSFRYDDSNDLIEESFEVSVRNRKKEAVQVVAREYLYRWSGWKVTSASRDYEKRDARTIDFPLEIPADGEAKFTYTVRYSW
jgi:hypothetical protein